MEIISPRMHGVLKIKEPKISIMPNPTKFLELQHVESAIVGMTSIPDFGYEQDNIILDRGPDAPRNWKLLTDFVWNKDKYQWLQNHLVLRKLRQKAEQQEEQKKFSYHKKTNPDGHKKDQNNKMKKNHNLRHKDKEMDTLMTLKNDLNNETQFMKKLQRMNYETNKNLIKTRHVPHARVGSVERKTLVDR